MKAITTLSEHEGSQICLLVIPKTMDAATISHVANELGMVVPVKWLQGVADGSWTSGSFYSSEPGIDMIYPIVWEDDMSMLQWKKRVGSIIKSAKKVDNLHHVIYDISLLQDVDERKVGEITKGLVYGFERGFYDYKKLKNNDWPSIEGYVRGGSEDSVAMAVDAQKIARSAKDIMYLIDLPANIKTPVYISDWMKQKCEEVGITYHSLKKEKLEELGMDALLAVNRGSEIDAECLVLDYNDDDSLPHVGLVGKGVTFDTGGISIKGSKNMHYMKSDMGGAAAVLGTILAAARLQLPVRITAIVPLTDNSVGTDAIKPGDVISSYKGSTIEVINTDAEGRLILADGIAYMIKHKSPDYLIDLATLTGSIIRSLGLEAAGLMTTNEELADQLYDAGQSSGERLWRMPLWDDYYDGLKSDVADIKNLSDSPYAGAITAGMFLKHFTDDHPQWAHLDIAGMAFHSNPWSKDYGGTGFGVDLLISWMQSLSK